MVQTVRHAVTAPADDGAAVPPALWRIAGALALAHVVLLVVGLGLQGATAFEEGVEGIRRHYVEGDLARILGGGMLEGLGFVLLLPTLVFLSRVIGRRTEAGRWAAQTALLSGVSYVAATMAVGFPAGAVAAYGAQHGLDLDVAFAINNLRNFAYFLSLALLGAHAFGLGLAALQGSVLRRWVGWGGLVTGAVLLASVPAASIGQQDWGTLLWLVWWVGVAVGLLRHRGGVSA